MSQVMMLTTMNAVANHPEVRQYRKAQEHYVRRMSDMYGADFANEGSGHEGVNRWTRAQRDVYESLMRGAKSVRDRVRAELSK